MQVQPVHPPPYHPLHPPFARPTLRHHRQPLILLNPIIFVLFLLSCRLVPNTCARWPSMSRRAIAWRRNWRGIRHSSSHSPTTHQSAQSHQTIQNRHHHAIIRVVRLCNNRRVLHLYQPTPLHRPIPPLPLPTSQTTNQPPTNNNRTKDTIRIIHPNLLQPHNPHRCTTDRLTIQRRDRPTHSATMNTWSARVRVSKLSRVRQV